MPLPRELTREQDTLSLRFLLPDAKRPLDLGINLDSRLLGLAFSQISVIPLPPHLSFIETIRDEQAGQVLPIEVSRQFLTEDGAALPAAIQATLGMDPLALLRGFESLGTNCEFGIVQRKLGLEVLNMFRFCGASVSDLIRALADDLKAADDPAEVTVSLDRSNPREYIAAIPAYNARWHTFVFENDSDQQTLSRTHAVRLAYLRRKFFEGLRAGRKIYVMNRHRPIRVSEAVAMLMELSRHAPAALLCVEPAAHGRRPGEVELLLPGLMRGYVERADPGTDIGTDNPNDWLRVIANAALLRRGPNAIFNNQERTE